MSASNLKDFDEGIKGKTIKEKLKISNGYILLSQLPKDEIKIKIISNYCVESYEVNLKYGIIQFDKVFDGAFVEVEYISDGILIKHKNRFL